MPCLRHIANLWTLIGHPTPETEWTLDRKLDAIVDAGFDGVCWAGSPKLAEGLARRSLLFVGGMASCEAATFVDTLAELKRFGAHHVNVQLGADSLETPQALALALLLLEKGRALGLEPAIESHRGTCTETPEKLYGLAEAYQASTGELLPISWDFSHFAVVKHLLPSQFAERLLIRPDLVQHARQFHLRPFNGHHAQVPITRGDGSLTLETKQWIPFAEATLRCWAQGNRSSEAEVFVCPELGPLEGGYALSAFPDSWEDAKVLRREIDAIWRRVQAEPLD